MSIHIYGHADMQWDDVRIESEAREVVPEGVHENEKAPEKVMDKGKESRHDVVVKAREGGAVVKISEAAEGAPEPVKKKSRRRSRHRRKKPVVTPGSEAMAGETPIGGAPAGETPVDVPTNIGETPSIGEPAKESPVGEANKAKPKAIKSPISRAPNAKSPVREAPVSEASTSEAPTSDATESALPVSKAPRRRRRSPSRAAMQKKNAPPLSSPPDGDIPSTAGEE
jgi:hypothetical protein